MSEFGKKIIRSLRQLNDDVKSGKPVRQSIVHRMIVKGKTVYTRETFMTPIK